jgi:uncharacterized protein YjbI with pentapeptide repeats
VLEDAPFDNAVLNEATPDDARLVDAQLDKARFDSAPLEDAPLEDVPLKDTALEHMMEKDSLGYTALQDTFPRTLWLRRGSSRSVVRAKARELS